MNAMATDIRDGGARLLWPPWLGDIEALPTRLREARFVVSIGDELRLRELVRRMAEASIALKTLDDLVQWLGPVLCRNPDQVVALRRILGTYERSALPPEPLRPSTSSEVEVKDVQRRRRRLYTIVGAVLLVCVVAAGVIGYRLLPAPPACVPSPTQQCPGPVTVTPKPPTPTPTPIPQPQESSRNWPAAIALAIIPVIWLAAFIVLRRRRHLGLLRDMAPDSARPELGWLANGEAQLFSVDRLRGSLGDWRRHRWVETPEIDVVASVRATVRAAGVPTVVRAHRPRTPDYAILIDRVAATDHLALIADVLALRLMNEQVSVSRFEYRGDPRQLTALGDLTRATRSRTTLDQVITEQRDRQIVMIGDPASFFDVLTRRVRAWVEPLRELSVIVLTPRPRAQWGVHERDLKLMGFEVAEASPEGVAEIGQVLRQRSRTALTSSSSGREARVDLQLSADPYKWLDDRPPHDEEIEQLIGNLEEDLDAEAMLLLAAIAVFPVVDPRLTMHVGMRLVDENGLPIADERRLGQIARLPWLRQGRMPEWLRVAFVEWLERPERTKLAADVRTAWLQVLSRVKSEPTTSEDDSLRLEFVRQNESTMVSRLWRQLTGGGDVPVRERVLLAFISGRPIKRVVAAAPDVWRDLFRHGLGLTDWIAVGIAAALSIGALSAHGGLVSLAVKLNEHVPGWFIAACVALGIVAILVRTFDGGGEPARRPLLDGLITGGAAIGATTSWLMAAVVITTWLKAGDITDWLTLGVIVVMSNLAFAVQLARVGVASPTVVVRGDDPTRALRRPRWGLWSLSIAVAGAFATDLAVALLQQSNLAFLQSLLGPPLFAVGLTIAAVMPGGLLAWMGRDRPDRVDWIMRRSVIPFALGLAALLVTLFLDDMTGFPGIPASQVSGIAMGFSLYLGMIAAQPVVSLDAGAQKQVVSAVLLAIVCEIASAWAVHRLFGDVFHAVSASDFSTVIVGALPRILLGFPWLVLALAIALRRRRDGAPLAWQKIGIAFVGSWSITLGLTIYADPAIVRLVLSDLLGTTVSFPSYSPNVEGLLGGPATFAALYLFSQMVGVAYILQAVTPARLAFQPTGISARLQISFFDRLESMAGTVIQGWAWLLLVVLVTALSFSYRIGDVTINASPLLYPVAVLVGLTRRNWWLICAVLLLGLSSSLLFSYGILSMAPQSTFRPATGLSLVIGVLLCARLAWQPDLVIRCLAVRRLSPWALLFLMVPLGIVVEIPDTKIIVWSGTAAFAIVIGILGASQVALRPLVISLVLVSVATSALEQWLPDNNGLFVSHTLSSLGGLLTSLLHLAAGRWVRPLVQSGAPPPDMEWGGQAVSLVAAGAAALILLAAAQMIDIEILSGQSRALMRPSALFAVALVVSLRLAWWRYRLLLVGVVGACGVLAEIVGARLDPISVSLPGLVLHGGETYGPLFPFAWSMALGGLLLGAILAARLRGDRSTSPFASVAA